MISASLVLEISTLPAPLFSLQSFVSTKPLSPEDPQLVPQKHLGSASETTQISDAEINIFSTAVVESLDFKCYALKPLSLCLAAAS